MGHIKEPKGINFIVDSKPLTAKEKDGISEIIAYYKRTGKKKKLTDAKITLSKRFSINKKELV